MLRRCGIQDAEFSIKYLIQYLVYHVLSYKFANYIIVSNCKCYVYFLFNASQSCKQYINPLRIIRDFNRIEIFIWPSFRQTVCSSFSRQIKRQISNFQAWPNKNLKSLEVSPIFSSKYCLYEYITIWKDLTSLFIECLNTLKKSLTLDLFF